MLFHATHVTDYFYSGLVFLEPHIFRLRPRADGTQQVRRFQMKFDPQPAGVTECLDIEGNAAVYAWFSDHTERFQVATEFDVETLRTNPFDFIIAEKSLESLPLGYPAQDTLLLSPYREVSDVETPMVVFANGIAKECGGKTLSFLDSLNRRIYQEFDCILRETGEPAPPHSTLREKRGSCRDFAVMFMAACRSQGIAARFVSGYQEGDPDQQTRYLHAWCEVYLPGAGWRGYDPTHGLAVGAGHVALAASFVPHRAAPVSGSFRGTGVLSSMRARIEIQTIKGQIP